MTRHKSSSTTFKYQVESIKEREQIMRVLTEDTHFGERDIKALERRRMQSGNISSSGRGGPVNKVEVGTNWRL
jgi:hypothetical protein